MKESFEADIIGYIAMSTATMIYIPLIYNICKHKSVKSISYPFLAVELITDIMWNTYANILGLDPLFYSSLLLFISACITGFLKYKYTELEIEREKSMRIGDEIRKQESRKLEEIKK